MTDKISIAIDMDDVLAGTTEKMVLSYNTLKETNYIPDDLLTLDLETVFDETTMMQMFNEINSPGFTRDLVVKENAIEVVKELNDVYDVYIATAAMEIPGSFQDKFEWLQEHFPFLDVNHYIYCGNKKVVRSDYLIDDNVKQLHQFRGTGILYTAHFNHNIEAPFTRINSWTEAHGHFIDNRQHRIEETRERRVKAYEKSLAALK
ncbi:5'(3')-deoxyribonucleotidase [Jeotgalibaca porci]|uniref:5' nucleotidase, NT5C type n=1 Tax=Jeotgalibaca porci TaxID=1868793 RepID=UPI00359F7110